MTEYLGQGIMIIDHEDYSLCVSLTIVFEDTA